MVETSFADSMDLVRVESQHSLAPSHLSTPHHHHHHHHHSHHHLQLPLLHRHHHHQHHQHQHNSAMPYATSTPVGSLMHFPNTTTTTIGYTTTNLDPMMDTTGVDLEPASAGLMSPVDSSSWSSISTPSPRSPPPPPPPPTFDQSNNNNNYHHHNNNNLAPFDTMGRVDYVQHCVATKTKPGNNNNNINNSNNQKDEQQQQRSLFTKHRISSMLHNKRCSSSLSRTPSPPNILQSSTSSSSATSASAPAPADDKLCKVCGAPGLGRNFSVFTCGSCKIFFRRNVSQQGKLRCRSNGMCVVNKQNRRSCSACRLRKCLTEGMKVKVTKKERNSNSTSSNENHTEDEWSASSSAALRNGHRHSLEDEPEESNDVPEADEEEDFDEGRQGFECLDFDLPELVPIEEATEVHKVSGNEPVTLTTIEEQTLAPPAVNMVEESLPMDTADNFETAAANNQLVAYSSPLAFDVEEDDLPENDTNRLELIDRFVRNGLELAKKSHLTDAVNTQVCELSRLIPHIRLRLGLHFCGDDPESTGRLLPREQDMIDTINEECSSISSRPRKWPKPSKVFNSLERGIYYANQSFKMFERFWNQNHDFSELIRQDETSFNKKRNTLLHHMYHLRGVHFFDERENAWAITKEGNANDVTLIKVDMFKQSVKKEMSAEHLRYINSFPKEWREDPTIVNLMTYLLMYLPFEYLHANFKCEKIRFYSYLYMLSRYLDKLYQDKQKSQQMLDWTLRKIKDELASLCSECLTACTHSLNPQLLEKIGPNYAACLHLEQQEKKEEEEHRQRHRHCCLNGQSQRQQQQQQTMPDWMRIKQQQQQQQTQLENQSSIMEVV